MDIDGLDREILSTPPGDRFMLRLLVIISCIATAFFAPMAHAGDEPDASLFSFSGFGTFGVAHSSEDQADFTAGPLKPNGAGFTRAWSADVDSLIGAQLIVQLNPKFSTVVQLISEQDAEGTYLPHVEWANLQYQFTPDFSIRVGRTVLPVFLLTATRKVGYTYPWVRPPLEVYRLLPLSSSDGADLSYRLSTGGLISTFQGDVGRANAKGPVGNLKVRRGWGVLYTAEYASLTARASWHHASVTISPLGPLFDAFRQFGPQGIAIADRNDANDKLISTVAIGVSYDPGQWFATSEWGSSHSHTFLGTGKGWFVSGGYRFVNVTPYLTYAESSNNKLSDPGLTVSALPPFLAGPATGLNAALNGVLSSNPVQHTSSIGARWDFAKNFDLKLQFDHIEVGDGSTGTFTNPQPGYQLGGDVNLFAATIDFVF